MSLPPDPSFRTPLEPFASVDESRRMERLLAGRISDAGPSGNLLRRWASVTAVAASSVTISLGGSSIPGVAFLSSYAPIVGDVVLVDFSQTDPVVLGCVAPCTVPAARVFRTTDFTFSQNTDTKILFDTENFDHGALHSTSSNTDRLTAPTAGLYRISAAVMTNNDAGGNTLLSLLVNDTTTIDNQETINSASIFNLCRVGTTFRLAIGDYVNLHIMSGQASPKIVPQRGTPHFEMEWHAP